METRIVLARSWQNDPPDLQPYPGYPCDPWFVPFEKNVASLAPKEFK
jgi:hypothetical protein